ncbi:MAG: DUF2202 domain-containing protein [Methyloprofundus sp.]|nr:DUF2202 domain-containing protein [Methyloprofundus sp.]
MIQLNTKLTAIAFALSMSFSVSAADDHGSMQNGDMKQDGGMQNENMDKGDMQQGGGMKNGMMGMGTHCPLKLNANQFVPHVLPEEVKNDLFYMREEEKLARDVYQALYLKWFSTVHGNISDSEQKHMDRIKIFLDVYGLEDSVSEEEGVFNNATLQLLYDELVAQGMESELEAYKVGAYVEEVDIKDLEESIKNTDIPELKKMYMQLKGASYKHLRKFHEKIVALEGEYTPQVLSQDDFDAILNAESGMMIMGNGIRVSADEVMGTNACFVSTLNADEQALQNGSEINADQAIDISYQVDVDANDVGKAADWIIVANYMPAADAASAIWFVRNGEQWQVWDEKLDSLTAAMSSDELQMMQSVPIFDGMLSDFSGKYTIFTGYRVEGNGLVYNPAPLMFSVK